MALWQLTEQVNENRSFDTRAGVVLSVAAAFAGLFGASLMRVVSDHPAGSEIATVTVSGVAVLIAFGWTMFAFYRTVRPSRWASGPAARELIEVASEHEEPAVRLWIAEALADSFIRNEAAAQRKATWFRRELYGAMSVGGVAVLAMLATTLARFLTS